MCCSRGRSGSLGSSISHMSIYSLYYNVRTLIWQLHYISITTSHIDGFGGCWCLAPLEDATCNIAPPLQLLCAWYVCMCLPGGCAAQLHETDIWPRDCAAVWFDLVCVVHDHTVTWPLRPGVTRHVLNLGICPVVQHIHLTWASAQSRDTDIWPGNLPSHSPQTFDLWIFPVAPVRHWDRHWDRHLTWDVAAARRDYMCHLCVSILDLGLVALARLPNRQPPIPSG